MLGTSNRNRAITVIIPSYDDRYRLYFTLREIAKMVSDAHWGTTLTEIIVVEDGRATECGTTFSEMWTTVLSSVPNVHIHTLPHKGKGYAIRHGVAHASGDLLLLLDADAALSIPSPELLQDRLIQYINTMESEGADIIIGSRRFHRYRENVSKSTRYISILSLPILRALNLGYDLTHGMKLYTVQAGRKIFSRAVVNNFTFDMEALYLARKLGYSVSAVFGDWLYAPGSTVRSVIDYPKAMLSILRVLLRDRFGRYE